MKPTSTRIRFTVAAFGVAAAAIGAISAASPALAADPGVAFDAGRPAMASVFVAPAPLDKPATPRSPNPSAPTPRGYNTSSPRHL